MILRVICIIEEKNKKLNMTLQTQSPLFLIFAIKKKKKPKGWGGFNRKRKQNIESLKTNTHGYSHNKEKAVSGKNFLKLKLLRYDRYDAFCIQNNQAGCYRHPAGQAPGRGS